MTLTVRHTVRAAIADDLLLTPDECWAGWTIPLRSYAVLSPDQQRAVRDQIASGLSGLRDVDCHLICAPVGYDADRWARQLAQRTPNPAPGFERYLHAVRRRLGGLDLWGSQVTLLVRLGSRLPDTPLKRQAMHAQRLLGLARWDATPDEVARWQSRATSHGRTLEAGGLHAERADSDHLASLIARQQRRGLPVDPPLSRRRYSRGAIEALGQAEYATHPRMLAQTGGMRIAWLVVDDTPDSLPFPGGEWLWLDWLGFPVEVSVRWRQTPSEAMRKALRRAQQATDDQRDNAAGAKVQMPADMQDAHDALGEIDRTVARDSRLPTVEQCRVQLGVWASTVDGLEDRVERLTAAYRDMGVTIHRPAGDQLRLHTAAFPGGRTGRIGGLARDPYDHRMPLVTLAGGMWVATRDVGDGQGWYVGRTGDGKPVHYDLHRAARENEPTGMVISGIPGQGKSVLAGLLAAQARFGGAAGLLVDPGNGFGRLAQLEGLGDVRMRELGSDDRGVLDPFVVSSGDDAVDLAVAVCQLLLPQQVAIEQEPALQRACREALGQGSLLAVCSALESSGEARTKLAGESLRAASRSVVGRLCFADRTTKPLAVDRSLTVLQVRGLEVPDAGVPRADWTAADRQASAALFMVAKFAQRLTQQLARQVPKVVVLDEAWMLTSTRQGARLVSELLRTGRKENTAVILVSQSAADLGDPAAEASVGVWVSFRAESEREVQAVLRLHGLDDTEGNRRLVRGLPPRTCLWTHRLRTGTVTVDLLFRELAEALDTTPTQEAVAASH